MALFRQPVTLGLLAQQEQQFDGVGGVGRIVVVLAGDGIGGIAERDHRRARQHHEEPDQTPLGLGARRRRHLLARDLLGAPGRPRRRRRRLILGRPSAAVADPERLFGLWGNHRGELSIRENPCCIIT
ncbi:MAG: hypothetical protein A3H48_01485 [Candidatus Rokubacteria bacterium RIFCSPLOWO2_02_FULL_71_18]|nr:MAG: hypothetical protein A3H48_01485 [Candidatus Rokubacteria bacterium RIFCSPLOWO2_02_FULL_71_18]